MVAYLKKPTGSEGFQEIVDSLNGSHIKYALTKNLTIYVSLIEKFWQTATVRTVDNGEQEITATVDGKEFTVTEASVRRHLQSADADVLCRWNCCYGLKRMGIKSSSSLVLVLEKSNRGWLFDKRLCQNLSVSNDHDPIHVRLAYWEHMVDYIWKYMIPEQRFKSIAKCG
nr:hypothetical protein [Tanacetum cinerariifolium]